MATLTIKNVPDEIYQALKQNAQVHHRSLNGEAIASLEYALTNNLSKETILTKAAEMRKKTKGLYLTDKLLTKIKNEGRE